MLSAYYYSLSASDKIDYADKLTLVNGIRLNDPYALGEWINDEEKVAPTSVAGHPFIPDRDTKSLFPREPAVLHDTGCLQLCHR